MGSVSNWKKMEMKNQRGAQEELGQSRTPKWRREAWGLGCGDGWRKVKSALESWEQLYQEIWGFMVGNVFQGLELLDPREFEIHVYHKIWLRKPLLGFNKKKKTVIRN